MFNRKIDVESRYKLEVTDGVKFVWLKTMPYDPTSPKRFISMMKFAYDLWKMNFRDFGQPDAVYVSSMPIFSVIPGLRKARHWKVPLLFEIRDVWPLTPIMLGNVSKNNPMIRLIGYLERIAYRKASAVISVLPNTKHHVVQRGGQPDKWFHLPNGVSPDLAEKVVPVPAILKDQIPADRFIVMYTGTIGLANAMEYVVEAAHLLKENSEIQFVFVGDGYKKQELQELQSEYGIDNITWIPKVAKNQVHDLINQADVCLISWHDKPLYELGVSANKYFDYMLAGKPILSAGNIPGDPVGEANCGVIASAEDPKSIADGILKLFNMKPDERDVLGANGRSYVMKNHTYSHLAKNLSDILERTT